MVLFAVALTVTSACAINVGKGMQKKAAKTLPRFGLTSVRTYVSDRAWRRGLELDILGGAGMLLALSIAPMSVVQPASASGVAILAVVSHVYLGESLSMREWRGVASCALGIVVLSRFAEGGGDTAPLGGGRLFFAVILGIVFFLTPSVVLRRYSAGITATDAKRYELIKVGAQCGMSFALSAACVKIGMRYLHNWLLLRAPVAFSVGAALTALGLYFQTKGLRDGSSIVVVCVAGNVAQMCVAAVYGLMILGEPVPHTVFSLLGWITSWAFIMYGVIALGGSDSGAALAAARDVRGQAVLPVTAIGPGAHPRAKLNVH
ncbi:Magnesium transporter NIPA [Ostreococcus tauri]|uniref:Probable magnesium transporter n=1 Tax=Ostreococcus tauri TaxID=70448 RepID=Q00WF6_OSTTA|nr:Magnesium transporter NIPA [Ostreococcus tauri]OUS45824.1 hypothetical protein BE221DRAFT_75977 [Ostreococcus tauri]CAL56802.1 Magnesium transporter NIPA [Ostreococcus tauri]|eukprot:XP_003082847.1 Magnesium transporter NIPA [Ostreococcus tauri]